MAFETFQDAVTVNAVGQRPVTYLIRESLPQIALLDTLSLDKPVDWCIYRSHVATLEDNKRSLRKRSKRILVYGTGQVTGGQILLCADNMRTESYPVTQINLASTYPNQQILLMQGTSGLVGRTFDCTLVLFGTNINVTELEMQFIPINSGG